MVHGPYFIYNLGERTRYLEHSINPRPYNHNYADEDITGSGGRKSLDEGQDITCNPLQFLYVIWCYPILVKYNIS
jgi:hypothetical protein